MKARTHLLSPQKLRQLVITSLPEETSLHASAPEPRFVYLPPSHVKALRPDAMVVVGIRGAGKSFWWSALQDVRVRALVAHLNPYAEIEENTRVDVGFGERPDPESYPDRDTLLYLLHQGKIEARLIWKSILVHKLASKEFFGSFESTWRERIEFVKRRPEEVARLLVQQDEMFAKEKKWFLVLFDALDRSAGGDWKDMHTLIRGLLETALEFRSYRRIRIKCFLRTDQLDENRVANFPDASKVLSTKVELSWPREDLYGLLWQYLVNSNQSVAEKFRRDAHKQFDVEWKKIRVKGVTVWRISAQMSRNFEETQRNLFHALAGKWMGKDRRRGFPYTWIPNHLSDAYGRTSPRSFLAALREAAEDTHKRYPNHEYALHYESIKRGVQKASKIRVDELQEDYPWVDLLMKPLGGLVVPCDFSEVKNRWEKDRSLEALQKRVDKKEERLPPAHLEDGPEGIRKDLEELGIFFRLRDGRVNIPDVFRVGYGLGRRGGVRPVR